MSKQQGVRKLFHRSFRHDGSHRYGLGECHPLPFRSLSGQRDGFRLRLRSCALSRLNSRGMVMAQHNRLDAPDVHARQAHHRASGGSAPLLPSPRLMAGRSAGVQECEKYVIKHNFNTRLHIPLKWRAVARSFPQGGRGVFRRTKGACGPFGNPDLADFQPNQISFTAKSRNLTKIVPPIYHGKPRPAEGERAPGPRAAPVLPCECLLIRKSMTTFATL